MYLYSIEFLEVADLFQYTDDFVKLHVLVVIESEGERPLEVWEHPTHLI